jgi:hypothetical protein
VKALRKEDRDEIMKAIESKKPEKEISPKTLALLFMASSKH